MDRKRTTSWLVEDFAAFLDEEGVSAQPPCSKRRKVSCGQSIDDATTIIDLLLGKDEMARFKLGKMVQRRKLHLVLDLDHTLLNSARFSDITPDEEYLMNQEHSLQDGSVFRLDNIQMVTKLRPFARKFLKEASDMFEMYIYTMANKPYAHEMANLLDPEGSYFDDSRIISKEDFTEKGQKGLGVVLAGMDSEVVILDDTQAVWQKQKENLIVMDKYNYFHRSHSRHEPGKSLSERKTDEPEEEGLLATMLGVLRRVHSGFFNDTAVARDVREVLKATKKEALQDCKIVFTQIVPFGCCCRDSPYWKTAEDLGAMYICDACGFAQSRVRQVNMGCEEQQASCLPRMDYICVLFMEEGARG